MSDSAVDGTSEMKCQMTVVQHKKNHLVPLVSEVRGVAERYPRLAAAGGHEASLRTKSVPDSHRPSSGHAKKMFI
jgi:hypothetical protein